MKLPHDIEITTNGPLPKLVCLNCGAESEMKHKARFLRRHPMECVRAILERRKFTKQLAQGVRSVEDTERRGGKYGAIN